MKEQDEISKLSSYSPEINHRLDKLSSEDRKFFSNMLHDLPQKNKILAKFNTQLLQELEILRAKASIPIERQKRDPLRKDIYQALIHQALGPSYLKARLRISFCLLTIFGVNITEILKLKVSDIKPFIDQGWITIDRSKRGYSDKKAFLSREGKKLLHD